MKQDPKFTEQLQAWINTPDAQKNWDEGAIMLLQLSGNKIMYRNISVNPKGKAEFIKGQLQKYLNFRLKQMTKDQVNEMQAQVDVIVEKVIKPNAILQNPSSVGTNGISESDSGKSQEFADFKAGRRADHDMLPAEIQALYVENLDIVHRMRELHLKLRTLSLENATCPDSERYPFLKEIIALDKKRVENWDVYDHFIPGTPLTVEEPDTEKADDTESSPATEDADKEPETSVNPNSESVNPEESTVSEEQPATIEQPAPSEESAPAEEPISEAKPKKATAKRTTKKASKKQ
jgi:hypothetical protein